MLFYPHAAVVRRAAFYEQPTFVHPKARHHPIIPMGHGPVTPTYRAKIKCQRLAHRQLANLSNRKFSAHTPTCTEQARGLVPDCTHRSNISIPNTEHHWTPWTLRQGVLTLSSIGLWPRIYLQGNKKLARYILCTYELVYRWTFQ